MKPIKIVVFFVLLFFGKTMPAQILSPVQSKYRLSKDTVKKGDELMILFSLNINKNWHVYSNIQDYELGPLPATFYFEPNNTYKLLGDVVPVGCKEEYERVFGVNVNYFEGSAEFQQKVKILSENLVIKGFYEYQICNALEGKCIMKTEDFEFKIKK